METAWEQSIDAVPWRTEGPETEPQQYAHWAFAKGQRQLHGERVVFSTNDSAILDIHVRKKKKKKSQGTQTHTYTFPKIKSKWILDLRVKCKIIKLLEERLKAWSKKEKNARFNFIKTKNLSAKDAAGRMKRQAIYWKIVCKIHIREKVFYVKYVKNS